MKRVIVSNLVSLDGCMAGPGGEIDWFTGLADKEFENYAVSLLNSIDTMLFGRVTYELMAAYWPTARPENDDPRIIQAMNTCHKVVFSRTLQRADWQNTRLVQGEAADEVEKLKRAAGKDIVVYGSGGIVTALASRGLIDDYRVFIAPVVLGRGLAMFRGLPSRIPLTLHETRTFRTGLVLLRYAA